MPGRYLIVAGDPSGDLLAEGLVRAIRKLAPGTRFAALGGSRLKASADTFLEDLVSQYAGGFWIPLGKLLFFRRTLAGVIRRELAEGNLTGVILVDFYGFNRHVAELAHRHGKPVFYYACPQFWASRPGRLEKIRRFVNRFLVLFPFEVEFYRARGLSATFVGHPLLDPILESSSNDRARHVEPLIGLLPGSRPQEVRRHLPVMLEACDRIRTECPRARFVLFVAPGLDSGAYSGLLESGKRRPCLLEVVRDEGYAWRSQLDAAITASGLETLENALLGIPMVVIYKMPWITYGVARSVVTVPWISMPNLLAGKPLVPELIQSLARPEPIARILAGWLRNPGELERLHGELAALKRRFGEPGASERAARVILEAGGGVETRVGVT